MSQTPNFPGIFLVKGNKKCTLSEIYQLFVQAGINVVTCACMCACTQQHVSVNPPARCPSLPQLSIFVQKGGLLSLKAVMHGQKSCLATTKRWCERSRRSLCAPPSPRAPHLPPTRPRALCPSLVEEVGAMANLDKDLEQTKRRRRHGETRRWHFGLLLRSVSASCCSCFSLCRRSRLFPSSPPAPRCTTQTCLTQSMLSAGLKISDSKYVTRLAIATPSWKKIQQHKPVAYIVCGLMNLSWWKQSSECFC